MASDKPSFKIEMVSADHQNKGDIAANKAREWFEKDKVDVVSELVTTSVALAVQKIAKESNCALIAGSIPLFLDGKVHNTSVVINKNGEIIYLYSKMHLFGMFKEERFFAAGDTYEPFVLDGVACGASICYDLRFPELYRRLALKGAKVIFVPAEWPEARGDVWRLLLQARAVENQTYICGVNCVGTFKDDTFYGHSMIVAPNGKILVEGGSEEEILRGEIDLGLIENLRKKLNALDDVRPEIFAR